jgi:hypothetical protein
LEDLGNVAIVYAATSAFFAAAAALAALYAGHWTRRQSEIEVYFYLRDRYLSPEMENAMRLLWSWHDVHGHAVAEAWLALKSTNAEKYQELSRARRTVSRYFIDIARLYRYGQISRQLARMLTAVNGINCFLTIAVPMNEKHGTHFSRQYIRTIKTIREKYESGYLD